MAWARISDDFHDNRKVAELTVDLEGLAALGLWVLALSWVRADRRRNGIVPAGIAARLSAGNAKQLAYRLVQGGLWDEVEGGYRFHDFDEVYHPEGLSEKRSTAGRAGGRASGKVRQAKQLASSKIGTDQAEIAGGPNRPSDASTQDDKTSETSDSGSNHEATTKQSASFHEAKSVEASHARADATTHYPDASYEASLAPQAATRQRRATRIPGDFKVTPAMVEWSRERCPTVDGRHETEKFINHWTAKSGKDATKLDWAATWRNWMLRAVELAHPSADRLAAPPPRRGPIPADERCPLHRGQRKTTCGPCRADRHAVRRSEP
jgi:hypothetical protein